MPNPDFGINANLNVRSEVVSEASRLTAAFVDINSVTVTLTSDYTLLNTVKSAIVYIGTMVQSAGTTLAQQLTSLANDDGPNNVAAAFGSVNGAIDSLKTLMDTGLNTQLDLLHDQTGPFLKERFQDAFKHMRRALVQLTERLLTLQDGVTAAKASYSGMGQIPSSIVRSKVSVRVQNAALAAIVEVRARIGAIRYMVQNTLYDLEQADEFLIDVTSEAVSEVQEMNQDTLQDFFEETGELQGDIITHVLGSVACVLFPQLSELTSLTDQLSSVSSYTNSLEPSLEVLLDIFSQSSLSAYSAQYGSLTAGYISSALALQNDLVEFFQDETCAAIQETIGALISGGPYNRYCFARYSDRVYNLYDLHVDAASRCYEVEYNRLVTLADLLEDWVDLIMYDVEDLVYRVAVCVDLPSNQDACLSTYGELYNQLGGGLLSKVVLWIGLLEKELNANYTRLAACVKSARYSTVHSVKAILYKLNKCVECGHRPDESNGTSSESDETSEVMSMATVAGAVKAFAIASDTAVQFDAVDEKTITLESHYTRLYDLKTALTTIATQIATTGQELTDKLETLAPSTGPLPDVFTDVTSALTSLRTLLQTGLSTQTDDIQTMVGNYITDMLTDASDDLLDALSRLETQLGLLQAGIEAATIAYGGLNIPASFTRRYVSPKVIYELQRAIHDLKSDLPLVTYIIKLTLGHLENADIYLATVLERANSAVYEVIRQYDGFKQELLDNAFLVSDGIATPFRLTYTAQVDDLAFAMSELEQLGSYTDVLQPVLAAYEAALEETNRNAIAFAAETTLTNYLARVVKLDDLLDRFYDEKLCKPAQDIMQVLIASGPWADYCFSKYSPRLPELVSINANRFQLCYELEAVRLAKLYEIIGRLVQQILYDVENLAEDTLTCLYRWEDGSDCIALIGPYYLELSDLIVKKQQDLSNIIEYETDASYNRMAACVNGGKCGLLSAAEDLVDDVQACELAGPQA
ncbi:hypothetical protein ZHAS_00014415 [Anopheles sinensis]|uniref:Uncharacterized protein n=1 Tax=Anopheles sinensis TaxID=74873 RepID=A0A084W873_ANOSI|nr:hypothetical protein ZHAS_00014415 [Anopheles sinensis]